MLTPDYLDTVADPIIEIFERLQEEILADIVRRIVKTNYITPTAEWQTMKLQESGMLLNDIKKHIQKTLNLTDEELKELFEQATIENLSGHYTKADIIKLLKRDTTMYQSILSGLEKTEGHLTNLTMTTASAYQQLFIESLDDAYWKVNSGAFDYNSAIVNATDTMLKKGQTVIEYPSGWRNAVDVAVRRAVLTGINQTQGQVQMDIAEELGLDYVDVSAHLGARPSHAEWQGKRYCISGKDKKYPKFEDATGYGTGAGLCGWNCRHTFFATTRDANFAYSQKELDDLKNRKVQYNGKDIDYYDATQMQRSMERTSRGLRRDLVAINELPDSPEKNILFAKKSARLKEVEARYKDFSKQTGLFTQSERMRVYGYNKSLSRKVGKASEEYLKTRLTQDEIRAILRYTTGKASYEINEALRNGLDIPVEYSDIVANLDSALHKMPYFEGDISRSVYFYSDKALQSFLKRNVVGNTITYNEYISTKKGFEPYNPKAQVQIYIKNATGGKDISRLNPKEQEVLYQRGMTFNVVFIEEHDGVYYILYEE